ncbi:MAG: hypothetical protein KH062_07845 [Streptococcus sp.]|uniref:YkvI family membrane protein n=1 Tax=Streptococcus sp. TaxID=1306 RepID=UPI0025FE25D3|nr:hypothetical protein [Streptococcus sp.]MBS7138292.1 hypothetical protein [Streptococcus sp.]
MSKRIWSIALAYVGVMIGAGVSSGQDLLQYFVSFGAWGLIGVIVLGVLHVGFGRLMIALGSYYQSDDHSVVLAEISHPVIYRILDIALIITCFIFGFVMTAGAGANLNQQFGMPFWVGAFLCTALTIVVSFLDFKKIIGVIGVFTPMILVMIAVIFMTNVLGRHWDFAEMNRISQTIQSPFSSVWMSVVNYFAVCVMSAIAMAFVMGGSIFKINEAEKSGAWGGFMVSVIFFITTLFLFVKSDKVVNSDVPMLAIAKEVNPIFATLYAFVIFGLIFNTVFSLYYALGKRFAAGSEKRFKFFVTAFSLSGFLVSFMGFRQLVAVMYPVIGYMGLLMLVVLVVASYRKKAKIRKEKEIRNHLLAIVEKAYDPNQDLTPQDREKAEQLRDASIIDNQTLREDSHAHVRQELGIDEK